LQVAAYFESLRSGPAEPSVVHFAARDSPAHPCRQPAICRRFPSALRPIAGDIFSGPKIRAGPVSYRLKRRPDGDQPESLITVRLLDTPDLTEEASVQSAVSCWPGPIQPHPPAAGSGLSSAQRFQRQSRHREYVRGMPTDFLETV